MLKYDCKDSAARRYVEHDTTAQETFGEIKKDEFGNYHSHGIVFRAHAPLNVMKLGNSAASLVSPITRADFDASPVDFANDNARPVAEATRRGPYITTYTGRFYMFDPRPEDWCIADVAHGLANICRYTGAGTHRYAVAEHSVHVYRELKAWGCSPDVQIAGLMHDSPESLSGFGDAASPAKKRAPIIGETEDNIWRKAIAPALGLPLDIPEVVHIIDMRICADEMSQNLWEVDPKVGPPLGIRLEYWDPTQAEDEFVQAFKEVQKMRVAG